MSKAPEHIIRDLMHKCGDDVSGAIMRTAALLDDAGDRAVIATGGCGQALGLAVGFFMHGAPDAASVDEAVDALWERLRPLAIKSVSEIRTRRA